MRAVHEPEIELTGIADGMDFVDVAGRVWVSDYPDLRFLRPEARQTDSRGDVDVCGKTLNCRRCWTVVMTIGSLISRPS